MMSFTLWDIIFAILDSLKKKGEKIVPKENE
jgi:hypothetical protein